MDENLPRRFQFRLRTLFVVAAIVAVQCAVCLPMLRNWEARREYRERVRWTIQVMSAKPQDPAVKAALSWLRRHAD
jgi:hypothetical protein